MSWLSSIGFGCHFQSLGDLGIEASAMGGYVCTRIEKRDGEGCHMYPEPGSGIYYNDDTLEISKSRMPQLK